MTIGQNTAAGDRLKAYAERMEHLLDEMDALKDDLKDLKTEAKNEGFNIQALSKLVAIRRNKDGADKEAELLNDLMLYAHATGTPLDVTVPEEEPADAGGAQRSGAAEAGEPPAQAAD